MPPPSVEAAHTWDSSVIGLSGPLETLLLQTRGRRSGKERYAALQYVRPPGKYQGLYVVVASMGGLPTHPSWYLNLLADPNCELQVGLFSSRATARTVADDGRHDLWAAVSEEQPACIRYQARTEREIPVVVFDLCEAG